MIPIKHAFLILVQVSSGFYLLADIELLTDREREVADLVMKGAANADIAETLKIKPRTVKAHISRIFEKYNVRNRVTLAMKMYKLHQAEAGNTTC